MKVLITTRSVSRRRSITLALAASVALALPVPALAQEAAESPAAQPASTGLSFPVMLGGQLLTAETYSGSEWLAQFPDDPAYVDGTRALVESAGKTIDHLIVKSAAFELPSGEVELPSGEVEIVPGETVVVTAVQIEGTDAREWVQAAVDLMVGDVVDPGLLLRPLGNKWTLRVTDATMPGVYPRTVYLKDDVAWIIQGDNDYVWDALSQLPDPDAVGLSTADSLYTDVPLSLDGARRIGLYESTEPLFLPTLGERLGTGMEQWLLDLYLEAGISPAEMLGVIEWWGVEAAQDGIQIEGYRLPEGGEALTQRLLEEVILVRPPEAAVDPESPEAAQAEELAMLLDGVSFSEEEIAGQAVTVLDRGTSRQYIFGSADTVWVISDPLGERTRVEEAIAALP